MINEEHPLCYDFVIGVVWGCDLNGHQPRYCAPRGLFGTIFGEVRNLALQLASGGLAWLPNYRPSMECLHVATGYSSGYHLYCNALARPLLVTGQTLCLYLVNFW